MIGTQIAKNRYKPQPFKHKLRYAKAVTVCIGAICTEREAERIILCSDRKLSYDGGVGSADIGFKLSLAGPGWGALIAGSISEAERILSFYRAHLSSANLTSENFLNQLTIPLNQYRAWLAEQYLQATHFVTMDQLLAAPASTSLGQDRKSILKRARSIPFQEQLILSGYAGSMAKLVTIDSSGVADHSYFACIGSGSWLSHAALLQRGFTAGMDIDEALYLVYEAKRFSEKENSVGPQTLILVQEEPLDSNDPALTLRTVSHWGIRHLGKQYRKLALQRYRPLDYKERGRFYV